MPTPTVFDCGVEGCGSGDCPVCRLRRAWLTYSARAKMTDGHTEQCAKHGWSGWASCTCGFVAVEEAIRRLTRPDLPTVEPMEATVTAARSSSLSSEPRNG